jgi:uncharacterized protein YjbI with pentapeptide repeats
VQITSQSNILRPLAALVVMQIWPLAPASAADPGHVIRLLESRDCERCDLSGGNLRGVDAKEARLTEANLAGADSTGAVLARAQLAHANLDRANLSNANLIGPILRACLSEAAGSI